MGTAGTGALAERVSGAIDHLGLTADEVGLIIDASGRSVARWTGGEVVPQRLNKQRLLELAYVADALAEVLPPDHANSWFFSPHRRLDHEKPAELIKQGRYRDVLNLIEAMADGVFA
ncbi:MAG: MbcA/ParS/Xre antitoxin family protein [Micrococcales bacterium]|nr:MbcA/ParS/Xre antitoxin family protein [Micrococcales bacterium]